MSQKPQRSALEVARNVLEIEAAAILGLLPQVDEAFEHAVELISGAPGRVVCTGMGKSGLVMRKVAATFSSTGTPALFLHPAEAIHGDLGAIVEGDVVLAASFTGRTDELLRLAEVLKVLSVSLVVFTGDATSPLAQLADIHLATAIDQEACPLNLAPTASTTALLALGDALAMALQEAQGFTQEDFARVHPGGALGRRLMQVRGAMRTGDRVPRVGAGTGMPEALLEMSGKALGITAVTDDDGVLLGAITDGDLRRVLVRERDLLDRDAASCMTPNPKTIDAEELASTALERMGGLITSLFVCDDEGRLEGIVHIHDLLRVEQPQK